MRSCWGFFQINNQKIDYEGPACFHEFESSGKRLILIGDKHWGTEKQYNLTLDEKRQYCSVLTAFVDANNSANKRTRVYIEKSASDLTESFDKWGFIDCVQS